jgi:hypothetical protein
MSTCESVGLHPRLVPQLGKRNPHADKRRSKYGLLEVGIGDGGKYAKQFKRAKELLAQGDSGRLQRVDLVSGIAKSFRVENKMAGYWVKNWIDSGALKDA